MMKIVLLLCGLSLYMYAISLGETLFNGNCVTCHKIDTPNSAPTIGEIQMRYKKALPTQENFVGFMARWVQKPDAKTALMPEAISHYGLMPELGFDQETLEEIARYLYQTKF
jgi:mono/diheme cytochrome c family protein